MGEAYKKNKKKNDLVKLDDENYQKRLDEQMTYWKKRNTCKRLCRTL